MRVIVSASGLFVIGLVAAVVLYLARESKYAFAQEYGFGYRVALQAEKLPADYAMDTDLTSSVLKANPDGAEGVDEKEEVFPAPTLADIESAAFPGFTPVGGIATTLQPKFEGVPVEELYKDDWRPTLPAEKGTKFYFLAYADSKFTGNTMRLAWTPENPTDPALVPHRLRLRLERAPAGITAPNVDVDLKTKPTGFVDLPTWAAATDADRAKGYVFSIEAIPTTTGTLATISNFLRHSWDGTLMYPRYGMWPLLGSTILMTFIAILIAGPISVLLALYLGDLAPKRVRETLKPTIELLASVPTVVLGFFGLTLVAPFLQSVLQNTPLAPDSGRMLLTAAVMMGFLLIPVITTYAEDALRGTPSALRDGGDALGLTKAETLRKIVLPAARPGIIGALLLGVARAFGETMIVWMLAGGTASTPQFWPLNQAMQSLTQSARGVPDAIAIDMANVSFEEAHYGHLFLLGLILFVVTLSINLYGYRLARKGAVRA